MRKPFLQRAAAIACAWASIGAAAPTSAPNPFTLEAASPAPAASALPLLPEIGRVRASSTLCTAIRDLVVPSIVAVREGDARYKDVAKRLHDYIKIVDDETYKQNSVYRQGALGQLDMDTIELKKRVLEINRALGDPRVSAEAAAADPAIAALRTQLQHLFDAQSARANLLQEYVVRERYAINKDDIPKNDPFGGSSRAPQTAPPAASPLPGSTPPPAGMPQFHGVAFADAELIDGWAHDADAYARAPEYPAARAFAGLAQRCR